MNDTIITCRGVQLRRRTERGPRGGVVRLYQAADASPAWGYWYASAGQAARESDRSDRVIL